MLRFGHLWLEKLAFLMSNIPRSLQKSFGILRLSKKCAKLAPQTTANVQRYWKFVVQRIKKLKTRSKNECFSNAHSPVYVSLKAISVLMIIGSLITRSDVVRILLLVFSFLTNTQLAPENSDSLVLLPTVNGTVLSQGSSPAYAGR